MKNKTYYDILGVSHDASSSDIKKAYFTLVKKCHPDVSQSKNSIELFQEIKIAYETLFSPEKRKTYDASLKGEMVAEAVVETAETSGNVFWRRNVDPEAAEELLSYRRSQVHLAMSRVFIFSLFGGIIGLAWVLFFQTILEKKIQTDVIGNMYNVFGTFAGILFAFFLSLDLYFKIETYLQHKTMKKYFPHVRAIVIGLSFLYLASFLLRFVFSSFQLSKEMSLVVLCVAIVITALFGSDNDLLHRIRRQKFMEVMILLARTCVIGVLGGVLGGLLGGLFWIAKQDPSFIENGILFGFAFAVFAYVFVPSEIQAIAEKTKKHLKYPLLIVLMLLSFVGGMVLGTMF